jgi:hypothetical protein
VRVGDTCKWCTQAFLGLDHSEKRFDFQIGVSIEDATRGLIMDFLVGYLGTSYFKGFLPKP